MSEYRFSFCSNNFQSFNIQSKRHLLGALRCKYNEYMNSFVFRFGQLFANLECLRPRGNMREKLIITYTYTI